MDAHHGDEEAGFHNNGGFINVNPHEEEKKTSRMDTVQRKISDMSLDNFSEGEEEDHDDCGKQVSFKRSRPRFVQAQSERSSKEDKRKKIVTAAQSGPPVAISTRRSTVESETSYERRSVFGSNVGYRGNSLSSNIGRYIDDLQSGDYWMPPTENEDPLQVDFRCACFKLTDISTVNFTTMVKFVVVFEWNDIRLKGLPITTNDLPGDLWGPDMILENAQNDISIVYDSFVLLNADQGRLKRTITYHGHISTIMELVDFPYDTEIVGLKFISINNWRTLDGKRHGNDPVNQIYYLKAMLDRDDVDFFIHGFSKVQEFEMLGWGQNVINPGSPMFPMVFKFDIHLVRMASFYVYKVLFPLWLIAITSLATFAIDSADLQGRLEVLFTLLLSTIALVYVVQESIPKISFLTLVDKIVNITLLQLALAVLFSYVISLKKDNAATLNLILALANQSVYWILNSIILIPPYIRFRKNITEYVKKQEELDAIRALGHEGESLANNRQSVHVAMRQSFKKKFNLTSSRRMSNNDG